MDGREMHEALSLLLARCDHLSRAAYGMKVALFRKRWMLQRTQFLYVYSHDDTIFSSSNHLYSLASLKEVIRRLDGLRQRLVDQNKNLVYVQ